jgi:predicted alpha/beta superfamily hydrolase
MKFILQFILLLITGNCLGQVADLGKYSIGEKHTFFSKILNEEREVYIYQPPGFWGMDESISNLPVVFVLDGESQFLNAVSTIDFISSAPMGNDLMPRSIVVGIPNTFRNRDLTPTNGILGNDLASKESTGGGLDFLNFLTEELIPFIDSSFSTSQHRTIIGHSLGGLITFQALLEKRSFFDNYLAIDPGFSFDNESYLRTVLDTLRGVDLRNENLYVATARSLPEGINLDNIEGDTSQFVQLTKSNIKFLKITQNEEWAIKASTVDYPEEDHFSIPFLATYDAMKFFYRYYPFKEIMNYYHPSYKDSLDLIPRLKRHYGNISETLGFEVKPMVSYIQSWAYGMSNFGRTDLAVALFDYAIEIYPKQADVLNNKAYFMQNKGEKEQALDLFESSLSIEFDQSIFDALERLKK